MRDPRHGGSRTRGPAQTGARRRGPAGDRAPWHAFGTGLVRYLPLSVLATVSVAVVPAVLAATIVPAHGVAGHLAAVLCAVSVSLLIATAEAWIWQRLHGQRGIVYGDLMLWSFARRLWAERRLKRAGAAYRSAVRENGVVRVELLEGLSHLLEIRNPYTYGHCRRVARHAEQIGRAMHLGPAEVAEIRTAALVHDVGKVYTPPEILHKQAPLDDEEFDVIKRHSVDGADMLRPVRDPQLSAIVRHHHERIDGSGYPDGLSGVDIPLGARIIAVADTFDAITSHRPYRRARSQHEAIAVLEAEAGRLLDADAVEAFARSYSTRRSIASMSLSAALSARIAATLQLLPGGLLGGASLAGVLPAVGAAGLLALTPGARYEKSASSAAQGQLGALQAAFPGALEVPAGPSGGAVAPGAGRPTAGLGPSRGRGPGAYKVPGAHPLRRGVEGVAGAQSPAGSTSANPSGLPLPGTPVGSPEVHIPETPIPPVVPPAPPPVHLPPVNVPPVNVPPVKVPPVNTPSVTTPQTSVGPATVPSVTVQASTPPGVQLPGVHIGH